MYTELSLMIVSAAVMIFLISHKRFELARGTKTIVNDMRAKADPVLRDIHKTTDEVFSGFTLRNFVLLINHMVVFIVRSLLTVSHRVHGVLNSIVEKASKKKEDLTRSGSASFYLKQIRENRENDGEKTTEGTGEEEEKM